MIKSILSLTLIFTINALSKECYTIQHKKICYKRYFDISSIYRPALNTKYYKSKNGKIYSFENNIDIRFKRIGAILNIEDDFEIQYVDKNQKETYLYKLTNPNELFTTISNLNETSYISKAIPIKHRILTIQEYKILQNSKKVSMRLRLTDNK